LALGKTLRVKKGDKIRRQEGVSPPPCPTPNKIFFGQGLTVESLKISEIYGTTPISTGVAKAAGRSPGSVGKFLNILSTI
jgi:hypothetical protein